MLVPFSLVAVSFLSGANLMPIHQTPNRLEQLLNSTVKPPVETTVALRDIQPETPKELRLICKGCNDHENRTLAFLQDEGIRDKNALATIMGNIRQESTFVPNICEGGARTSYHGCRYGGYGLIQWTDSARYHGLGKHARKIGGDPSSLETQLSYLTSEPDWEMIEHSMKTPGKSIERYMQAAKRWIRWGHHGARTAFAYDYRSMITEG
jgi:hypothetical protein